VISTPILPHYDHVFWQVIPSFASFHQQMGGYAVQRGAGALYMYCSNSGARQLKADHELPELACSSSSLGSISTADNLDLGFVANHVYCSETSHVRPTGLGAVQRSLSCSATDIESTLEELRDSEQLREDEGSGMGCKEDGSDNAISGESHQLTCGGNAEGVTAKKYASMWKIIQTLLHRIQSGPLRPKEGESKWAY